MMTTFSADDRGTTSLDWLDSRHSFSFGGYYDYTRIGFRALKVINEDHIRPDRGFDTHSHRDMEIVTYVLSGALEHKDSEGGGEVIRPGEVQRMTAGSGISHSEFNPSASEDAHLLQIWIEPGIQNLAPSYEQRTFAPEGKIGKFRRIVDSEGAEGAIKIHQDTAIFEATLPAGNLVHYEPAIGRHVWAQILRGKVDVNGEMLAAGDGIAISEESDIGFATAEGADILLFDLA